MVDENIWTDKHAPTAVEDMILNPVVRQQLLNVLHNPQNIILFGSPGVGKGTFTKIFLDKIGCDKMWKNASRDTGIDMIRNDIYPFANAASLKTFFDIQTPGDHDFQEQFRYLKVVVFNEAENLSKEAQNALRELMEDVERRCKFIYMTNDLEKIDAAIRSRCLLIEIKDPPVSDILHFMKNILNKEGISYDSVNLTYYVQYFYPDIRTTIKHVQGNCNDDKLDLGSFNTASEPIDRALIDLRMHITFYGLKRKDVYDLIKDKLEIPIQSRIFYMLLDPKLNHKVSQRKKEAVVKCISEVYPLKKWLYDYMVIEN